MYISPLFLAILFSINLKCSFHDRFSSNRMPRSFMNNGLFISWILIKSFGNISCKWSLPLTLWKTENSFFLMFKKNLFEINHSLIFYNSLFTVEKRMLMSLCSKNCFVLFANILFTARSFTYIKNKIGPRIDLCSTPHVISCSFVCCHY